MGILEKFLKTYENLVKEELENFYNHKLKFTRFPLENEKLDISEGSVFESTQTALPFLFTVVEKKENNVLIALMSDFWELGTNKDIFVRFSHPVRDTWIVETDITCVVPKSFLENFRFAGKLSSEDIAFVKKALSGEEIPLNKRGSGYNDRIHKQFKSLERDRLQLLFSGFMEKNEEKDLIIIKFNPKVLEVFEPIARELLVACSDEKSIETNKFKAILNPKEKKISLLINEEFLGKPGNVIFDLGLTKISLYKGILKDLEFLNANRLLLNLLRKLKIEVKNDSKTHQ
jgi:hypothetical protein